MPTTSLPQIKASLPVQIPVGTTTLSGLFALGHTVKGLVIIANADGDHLYDETNGLARRFRHADSRRWWWIC